MIEDVVRPRGPYRLHLMTYGKAFDTVLPGGGRALAWQGSDGLVRLRAPDEAGLALLRFMVAVDADTTEFVDRFRRDPLLGPSVRHLHGLRPLRRATVAHAVLRAMCGQLIEARRALAIERAIVRELGAAPPTREVLGARSPAELRRLGLATHRASALIRICRTIDLESLRGRPVEAVAARLLRERSIGPWSLGVIGLEGLGSYRYGLVGDLGLVKLCAALWAAGSSSRRPPNCSSHTVNGAVWPARTSWPGSAAASFREPIRTSLGSCAFARRGQRRKIAFVQLGANSKLDLIRRVPLFSSASKPQLAEIASIADEIDLPEGKTIIKEGDTGREFFVLIDGTADVERGGRKVAEIGPGDFVGEIALIAKTPRNATITTTSPVRALVITDRAFRQLLDHSPQIQIGVLTALAERLAPTSL